MIEYIDHEFLTTRFHVTHYGGCALLFNKDTSFPDIKVTSIYLHDLRHSQPEKVIEGETGWVIQGAVSKASVRRQPRGGKSSFAAMPLHIYNNYAKKRVIGKKQPLAIRAVVLDDQKDLVAGDFNGVAWRRQPNNGNLCIIEEDFADSDLPMPPCPSPLWGPGAVQGTWSDLCGFLKRPDSYKCWKVRQHGAFSIPYEALGLRSKDQSCHHECRCTWISLTTTAAMNCVKNTNNGFSSKKGLLLTNAAKKGARQMRAKATVRFRPKRRRPFASVTSVHTCNAAP